jgi:hypothetical protein
MQGSFLLYLPGNFDRNFFERGFFFGGGLEKNYMREKVSSLVIAQRRWQPFIYRKDRDMTKKGRVKLLCLCASEKKISRKKG